MKFSLFFLISLVAATPVAQLGGGKSLLCQHDHLHLNPDCKSGAAAGSSGALAGLLKGAGGEGAGSSGGLAGLLKGAGGASDGAAAETPAAAPAADAGDAKAAKPKAAGGHSHGSR